MQNLIGKLVTFTSKIEDLEGYPEGGMRARIVAVENKYTSRADLHEHIHNLTFDFSEFDEFNKRFESSNYFDKNHNPTLTAREAGFYKDKEELFFGSPKLWPFEDYFADMSENSRKLSEEFKASGETDYVAWLEEKLTA